MLTKFIASTVQPIGQDTQEAWTEDGKGTAITYDPTVSYLYLKDLQGEEGELDITQAIEMALREDGPVHIIDKNYKKAEKICARLQEELEFDFEFLLQQYKEEDGIQVAIADDVRSYIAAQAKQQSVPDVAASNESVLDGQLEVMMKAVGLTVGMRFDLNGITATIKGFTAGTAGVDVVLEAAGRTTAVSASDVLSLVAQQEEEEEIMAANQPTTKEEETIMTTNTKGSTVRINQPKTEEATNMTNTNTAATSKEAMAFLAATESTKTQTNSNKGEKTMNTTFQIKNAGTQAAAKEESKAPANNAPAKKGTTMTVRGAGKAVETAEGKARGILSSKAKSFVADPNASKTQGGNRSLTPWYLKDSLTNVIKEEEAILAGMDEENVFHNEALNIELVALDMVEMYNAKKIRFLSDDYQLIVELKMANGAVVIPFQVGIYGEGYKRYENDVAFGRKVKPYQLFANNIQLAQRNGSWTGELSLSTKNAKEYAVKCSCGSQNTIDAKLFEEVKEGDKVIQTVATHKCWKCEKEINVAEVAQDAKGNALEFRNMGYIKRPLPFGFQFGEEVLAQVMAFAHVILKDDLSHPDFR